MRVLLISAALFSCLSVSVQGGVFSLTRTSMIDPFVVSHPPGYNGSGGPLMVRICIPPESEILRAPLQEAIEHWNTLGAMTQNCVGCRLWEEGAGAPAPNDLASVALHELGHCGMALDHTNLKIGLTETSFTASRDFTNIFEGSDGVRGSRDDQISPLPGTRVIHWFRKADNDPVVLDNIDVDSSTYTRRFSDLPMGSSWQANGNRAVSLLLTQPATQSVMYSGYNPGQKFLGLTADDRATVQYGMTGIDELAGTADDYTVILTLTRDCTNAEIEARYIPLPTGVLGRCQADLELITGSHRKLVPLLPETIIRLDFNSENLWDAIFSSGFEAGSTTGWEVQQ